MVDNGIICQCYLLGFNGNTICLVVVCMASLNRHRWKVSGKDFAHGCISSLDYRLRQSQTKREVRWYVIVVNYYNTHKKKNWTKVAMADYGLTTSWKPFSRVKTNFCCMSRNVNEKFPIGKCLPIPSRPQEHLWGLVLSHPRFRLGNRFMMRSLAS